MRLRPAPLAPGQPIRLPALATCSALRVAGLRRARTASATRSRSRTTSAAKRTKSASVTMPTSVPSSSQTGRHPNFCSSMSRAACARPRAGRTEVGAFVITSETASSRADGFPDIPDLSTSR